MIKKLMSLGLCICFVLVIGVFAKPVEVKAAKTVLFASYYNEDGSLSDTAPKFENGVVLYLSEGDNVIVGDKIYQATDHWGDSRGMVFANEFNSLQEALDYWEPYFSRSVIFFTYIGIVPDQPPTPSPTPTPVLNPISTGDDYYDRHYNYWITVYNQLVALPNNGKLTVDASGYNLDHVQHFVFDALNGTNRTLTFTFADGTYVITGKNLGKIALGNNYTFVLLTGLGYCVQQL
ncbi:MAG: hypothetical protein ACK5JF_04100 [Oscillospiraceae bacterium]